MPDKLLEVLQHMLFLEQEGKAFFNLIKSGTFINYMTLQPVCSLHAVFHRCFCTIIRSTEKQCFQLVCLHRHNTALRQLSSLRVCGITSAN